ncbi:hypothetical protein GCM10027061_15580 [Nesterenkonia suensis]
MLPTVLIALLVTVWGLLSVGGPLGAPGFSSPVVLMLLDPPYCASTMLWVTTVQTAIGPSALVNSTLSL